MTHSRSWFADQGPYGPWLTGAASLLVTACASAPAPVPVAVAPAPAPILAPPMPAGASPNMIIPAALPDGSYPTPNRRLSTAATTWHLRSALNVAALACRGPAEATIVARYNALLAAHKPLLASTEKQLSAEYRAGGADWRDRYDNAMTRLYNFFSQAPARDAFCQTADAVLAEAATVPAAGLDAFAASRLPVIDRAFTDFYAAYDAWRRGSWDARPQTLPGQVIALAAPASPAPPPPAPAVVSAAPIRPTPVVAARPVPAVVNAKPVPVRLASTTPLPAQRSAPKPVQVAATPSPAARPVAPRLELDPSVFLEP